MMRLLLASMALLVASVPMMASAGSAPGAERAVHQPRSTAARPSGRALALVLSPAPGDLTLAEVGFRGQGRNRISSRLLHIVVRGAFGDDYMAAAWLDSRVGRRALVLVVNRPSSLMDPAHVHLSLSWRRRLGGAFAHVWTNPIGNAGTGASFCDLTAPGQTLSAAALHSLGMRGAKLGEIASLTAVSQAYDLSCGLATDPAFVRAVSGSCTGEAGCEQVPPAPEEPAPQCNRCEPQPLRACPAGAAPAFVCGPPIQRASKRNSAGSH